MAVKNYKELIEVDAISHIDEVLFGVTTTISILTIIDEILYSGDELTITNPHTLESDTFTLSADSVADATSLSINSHDFTSSFPVYSVISFAQYENIRQRTIIDRGTIAGMTITPTTLIKTDSILIDAGNGKIAIGGSTASEALDVYGEIAINGTSIIYLPDQVALLGSVVFGTGGRNLVNTAGTDGRYNTIIGIGAGNAMTTAQKNDAIGYQAAYVNISGSYFQAIGYRAAYVNISGGYFQAIGYLAAYVNISGSYFQAIGYQAARSNTSGSNFQAIGYRAAYSNTSSGNFQAIGYAAAYSNTSGGNFQAIGYFAARSNTSGGNFQAIGYFAAHSNTSGSYFQAIGSQAAYSNTSGGKFQAIGYQAAYSNTSGSNFQAIGYRAAYSNTSGSNFQAIGYQAARYLADGSTGAKVFNNSTYVGTNTKVSAEGVTNENVFGYNATGNGSNSVTLGDDNILKTILKGDVGIGESTPSTILHIKSATTPAITVENSTTSITVLVQAFNTAGAVGTGTNHELGIYTDAIEAVKIDTSQNVGIGTTPTSNLHNGGSAAKEIVSKTADYTAADEEVIICDGSSNTVTITLPALSGITGRTYYIKSIDSTYTVTIDGNGAETIDGQATQTLGKYNCIQIIAGSSEWHIIN
jgi:hypothetical protein